MPSAIYHPPHGLLAVVGTLFFSTLLAAPLLFHYLKKEAGVGCMEILQSGSRPWISGCTASLVTWFFLNQACLTANLTPLFQLFLGGLIFVAAFASMIFLIDRKFIFFLLCKDFL